MRYTSLTTTISHDNNNNHRTSKHASTSWRSDGSTILFGWVITRVGPGQNPQYTRAHFGGGGCGLPTNSTTHNNVPKKTQRNNNMVAEQVLRDLSVRRASVMRSRGAQISVCPWSVQMFLM